VVEFTWVACGRTDTIFIPGTNAWDVASGAIIVKEAGGMVTDFNNKEWGIKSPDIIASNGLIHDDVLKVLKSV
jgi:myo-inositol-1(or 4)-monophosphatase